MSIARTWVAHRVRRFHSHPRLCAIGQNLADHSHGVATIVALLNPKASAELLRAALLHDAGERDAGDLPQPFKQQEPVLAAGHAKLEARFRQETTGVDVLLDPEEESWLKLADMLEAIIFCGYHMPHLLERRDWCDFIDNAIERASELDCQDDVIEALEDMNDEVWA